MCIYLCHWGVCCSSFLEGSEQLVPDVVEGYLLVAVVLSLQLLSKGIQI